MLKRLDEEDLRLSRLIQARELIPPVSDTMVNALSARREELRKELES